MGSYYAMSNYYRSRADRAEYLARYHAHLDSNYWQSVRQHQNDLQHGICSVCHQHMHGHYECHHKTYRAPDGGSILGRELDFPGCVTCVHPSCHQELHTTNISLADLYERVKRL